MDKPEKPEDRPYVTERNVSSADIELTIDPARLKDFLECVKRTGKLTLEIRDAGGNRIPPDVLSVVDARN